MNEKKMTDKQIGSSNRVIIPQQPQRQDDLNSQLFDLMWAGCQLGLYDAVDYIKLHLVGPWDD
jgi:hypothetical protein